LVFDPKKTILVMTYKQVLQRYMNQFKSK